MITCFRFSWDLFIGFCPEAVILALPYSFVGPLLNTAPTDARPLNLPKVAKAKRYIEVCKALLTRFATDSSARMIEFLLDIVRNADPGELPPVPWITTASPPDAIQLGVPNVVQRVAPGMAFEARFARRARQQLDLE